MVCNENLIPLIHYVERLTPSGKIKVFDIAIEIEIENEHTRSVHAWKARLNGRPYPNVPNSVCNRFGMRIP